MLNTCSSTCREVVWRARGRVTTRDSTPAPRPIPPPPPVTPLATAPAQPRVTTPGSVFWGFFLYKSLRSRVVQVRQEEDTRGNRMKLATQRLGVDEGQCDVGIVRLSRASVGALYAVFCCVSRVRACVRACVMGNKEKKTKQVHLCDFEKTMKTRTSWKMATTVCHALGGHQ